MKEKIVMIKANRNTLKCKKKSTKMIHFTKSNTLGDLLGFKPKILSGNISNISDGPVNICKVNAICIECNLINCSYIKSEQLHIIHEIFPNSEPGEEIVEASGNIIYLSINSRKINSITFKILDPNGELISLEGKSSS